MKNWQANYYGGETMRKETVVLNEVFEPSHLLLKTEIISEGNSIVKNDISLDLMAGDKWEQPLSFKLPEVTKRTDAVLNMTLLKDNREIYTTEYPVHIFPKSELPAYDKNVVGLYDTHGKTKRALAASGFTFKEIKKL